jgi:hypothetical protein
VLRAWLEQRGLKPGPLFINFDRAQKGRRLTSTSIYRIVRDLDDQVQVGRHGDRIPGSTAVRRQTTLFRWGCLAPAPTD